MTRRPSSSSSKGFTLLELIVVIVILGILAAIAIPTFSSVIQKSQQRSAFATLQSVDREMRAVAFQDQNQTDPTSGEVNLTSAQQSAVGGDLSTRINGKAPYVNAHGAFVTGADGVCYALYVSKRFDSPALASASTVTTYGQIGIAGNPANCG